MCATICQAVLTTYQEAGKYPFAEISEIRETLSGYRQITHLPELNTEESNGYLWAMAEKPSRNKYYESLLLGQRIIH